jgi:hypothetical protein
MLEGIERGDASEDARRDWEGRGRVIMLAGISLAGWVASGV